MKILRVVCLVSGILGLSSVCMAQGNFTLKIAMQHLGSYVEPLDRTFKIRDNYPPAFQVIVTNTDSSAQLFYENASSEGYSSISFEITDENGNRNVVRKKKDPNMSFTVTSTYMKPQERRVFEISIDKEMWENAYKLREQGARKFRVRAIYENNGSDIYSEYYNLEVTDSSGAQDKQGSLLDNALGKGSVLVSK